MKKLTGLLLLALLISSALHAQETATGNIYGKVLDDQQTGLGYVNILLLNPADSALIRGGLTDDNGDYSFQAIPSGKYLIMASMVGMKNTYTPIFEIGTAADYPMDDLVLVAVNIELATVEIKAQKPFMELKGDRIVMNVENSPVNTGNNALEVLAKAPAVTIDQNERISLKGKQGVLVIVNGKNTYLSNEELARMLAGMPAESIESIEIMHNPPAKYDAAGNAGIINIVLKKDKNLGFNGSLQAGIGKGRYGRANGGLRLNYRQKKFNLFGNYNYYQNQRYQDRNFSRSIPFPGGVNIIDQKVLETNDNQSHSFQGGADWFVNDKTTLGVLFKGNTGNWNMEASTLSDIHGYNPAPYSQVSAGSEMKESWENLAGNINWSQKFSGDGNLNLDLDYSSYDNPGDQYYENYFLDAEGVEVAPENNFRNINNSSVVIKAIKLDYSHPLQDQDAGLDIGLKFSDVSTDNLLVFDRWINKGWINDGLFSNQFMYNEQIFAAYGNFSKSWDKWSFQAGLRAENTQSTGESPNRDQLVDLKYLNLFPSLNLSRTLNDNNQFSLSYSRRIDRPTYQNMNPFYFFLDQFTYGKGNPFLRPQYSDTYGFSHSYKSRLITSLTYTRTTESISEVIQLNPETGEGYQTFDNLDNFENYSINVSAPVTFSEWWTLRTNSTAFYNRISGTLESGPLVNEQFSYRLYLSNAFTLPSGWQAELSGFYQSKMAINNFKINPIYQIDLGLSKSLFDGRGKLAVNVSDIFYTQVFSGLVQQNDLSLSIESFNDTRRGNLAFSYNFGNQSVKQARRRSTATDEEENRVKRN